MIKSPDNITFICNEVLAERLSPTQYNAVAASLKQRIQYLAARTTAEIRSLFARIVAHRIRQSGRAAFAAHTPVAPVFTAAELLPVVTAYMVGAPLQADGRNAGASFPQLLSSFQAKYGALVGGDATVPACAFTFDFFVLNFHVICVICASLALTGTDFVQYS